MRDTVFKNKWVVMLLLAVALALVTKFIGTARPPAQDVPVPEAAAAPTPAPTPAQAVEVEEVPEEDLIDPGTGMDATGLDPTPDAEVLGNEPQDPADTVMIVTPDEPVGEDPTPVD